MLFNRSRAPALRGFSLQRLFTAGMIISLMAEVFSSPGKSRKAGLIVCGGILLFIIFVFFGNRHEWFAGRCLLLATVGDLRGLRESSPVYYKGAEIGRVIWIREPETDLPGYKLRMRVGRGPFRQIALDACVRVDVSAKSGIAYVTVLPGRTKPDRFFPGKVKVLEEIGTGEQWFRMAYDILEGLENLSEAKVRETEVEDMKKELERLKERLNEIEGEEDEDRQGD